MTPDELAQILADHRLWLTSDRQEGKRADLVAADLGAANLRGANLRWANLRGANLRGAELYGARGVAWCGPVGSTNRQIIAVDHGDKVMVQAGCWWGTTDELRTRIAPGGDHGWTDDTAERWRGEYGAAITYLTAQIESRRVTS